MAHQRTRNTCVDINGPGSSRGLRSLFLGSRCYRVIDSVSNIAHPRLGNVAVNVGSHRDGRVPECRRDGLKVNARSNRH